MSHDDIQELLGYRAPEFAGSEWIAPVLGTAIFLYGGLVFLRGAVPELRAPWQRRALRGT